MPICRPHPLLMRAPPPALVRSYLKVLAVGILLFIGGIYIGISVTSHVRKASALRGLGRLLHRVAGPFGRCNAPRRTLGCRRLAKARGPKLPGYAPTGWPLTAHAGRDGGWGIKQGRGVGGRLQSPCGLTRRWTCSEQGLSGLPGISQETALQAVEALRRIQQSRHIDEDDDDPTVAQQGNRA
jgi:hypothetical protein